LIGIDVGILKYVHDTGGRAMESLDLSDERARLRRAHRRLSRKEYGSNNWESQRTTVARRQADLKRKCRDFLHKLSAYYAREYDLVAVEDLDTRTLIELPSSSRARTDAAWGTFLRMLEEKCEWEGIHFIEVFPVDTTTECSKCGVKTDKPLWVREHACPACGFETDRDANAARNILNRALTRIGMGCPESTLAETALPVETLVPAKRVVETGSPVRTDDR
jgi:putative transposase